MTEAQFATLKTAIEGGLAKFPNARAAYVEHGLTAERFRWDVLHAIGFDLRPFYREGLNDNHIDTALRRIVANRKDRTMWTKKTFKTFAEQTAWIAKNEHRYQIQIIIVNNGYAVEYKPLRIIG